MTALPIASGAEVRAYAVSLLRRHPRALGGSLVLYALAAVATLVAPRLLGDLVQAVQEGTTRGYVDRVALALAAPLYYLAVHWVQTASVLPSAPVKGSSYFGLGEAGVGAEFGY